MSGLTHKQAELLQFIRSYMAQHGGVPPSFSEMVDGVGLRSKEGIFRLLVRLEERGAIQRKAGVARSLVIVDESEFRIRLPAEVDAALREMAARQHVAPETLIRECVRAYVGCAGATA